MCSIEFRDEFDQLRGDFIVQVTDGNIAIYFSILGYKSDLVLELNDERIKKAELDTLVTTGGFGGSGNIHIRGVGGVLAESNSDYCVQIESSKHNCTSGTWTGSSIYLFHNNIEKATIPPKFEKFSFCLPLNYIDTENDKFKLHMKNSDGVNNNQLFYDVCCFTYIISLLKVCISSLRLNNEQVFVGKNDDLSHFSFDNDGLTCEADKMTTPLLTIQNGTAVSSICKGFEKK